MFLRHMFAKILMAGIKLAGAGFSRRGTCRVLSYGFGSDAAPPKAGAYRAPRAALAFSIVWIAYGVLWPRMAVAQNANVTVSLQNNAAELGQTPGRFVITRVGTSTAELRVLCTVTGTATPGTDYTISPACPVTIPAGPSPATATVTVTPVDDTVQDPGETVILTLLPDTTYGVGPTFVSTMTIADDTRPVVNVAATDPVAAEEGRDTGTFTISRAAATSQALTINCAFSGTATFATDYTVSQQCPVTIAPGASSVSVIVTPVDDTLIEGNETVILTLQDSPNYHPANNAATVTITDNDNVVVTVTAPDPNAAEEKRDPGTFSISRNGPTTAALTVSCNIGGTAILGSDYTIAPSCPAIIPAGSASVLLTVTPIDDSVAEGDETVTLTLTVGSGYVIGTPGVATVTIADNEVLTAEVTVTAPNPSAAEQGQEPGKFSVARTAPTNADLIVNCTIGGSASSPADYTISPTCPVTIPAGSSSITITVTPVDDNIPEGDETVTLTLAAGSGYTIGAPGSAGITIADNDATTLTVTATDSSASEQGPDPGTFSIVRNGPTTASLTVNCSLGGTATANTDYTISSACPAVIPAGAASLTLTVTPINDTLLEGDETVVLSLGGGAGYLVATPGSATITILDNAAPRLTMASGAAIPVTLTPSANPPIRFALNIPSTVTPSSATINGRVDVSFTPDPQSLEDPNMRFQNGQKSVNFTVPAGTVQATFVDANGNAFSGGPAGTVGFQAGTNAGTITFTVSLGGVSTTAVTKVDRLQPAIASVTVQRTSSGMSVSIVGFSTTRDITSVAFAFTGSGGSPPAISPSDVGNAFVSYFARRDDAAVKNGSLFLLTVPFTIANGTPDQFNSVKVTLTNSAGASEATTTY
jgi:hypothetical protein